MKTTKLAPAPVERRVRRSYAEEMAWAINQAYCANSDRNPNRNAQVTGFLLYGNEVAIARRGHEPIPQRPDIKYLV